jgi:hypothetical protein
MRVDLAVNKFGPCRAPAVPNVQHHFPLLVRRVPFVMPAALKKHLVREVSRL